MELRIDLLNEALEWKRAFEYRNATDMQRHLPSFQIKERGIVGGHAGIQLRRGHKLVDEPGDVVGHDHEVFGPAAGILDEVGEQGLGVKSEVFEDLLCGPLTGGHTRPDLLQPARPGDGEHFIGERLA